jgi:hypothetical protein
MSTSTHAGEAKDCLFVGEPNGSYRKDCADGYQPGWPIFWQAHHILPCSSVRDSHISKNPDDIVFIRKCLCITDWDINTPTNLIGLDTKLIYKWYPVTPYPLPPNLPSHLIDHGHYNKESYEYMGANVWDALKDARKEHDGLDPRSLLAELKSASSYFKSIVKSRGARNGGSIYCFTHRFDTGMEDKWYFPLSMSDTPQKRHPGIPNVWPWLDKIFQIIK